MFYINTKSIFTPFVARNLLKMGNPIIDIKPYKEDRKNERHAICHVKRVQYSGDILRIKMNKYKKLKDYYTMGI